MANKSVTELLNARIAEKKSVTQVKKKSPWRGNVKNVERIFPKEQWNVLIADIPSAKKRAASMKKMMRLPKIFKT